MTVKFPRLLFALSLTAAAPATCALAQQRSAPAGQVLAAVRAETDRDRDGLQGPVRRVRTETAKLVPKDGKPSEGPRALMETATYDMKGAKIDNAYFLGAGGALTGREVYKYDDRGNIVEMTLHNADGSVLSREKYDYEFDAVGNWTKMVTNVAVIENGQTGYEPSEVTYRSIAYYLEDGVARRLQPGQSAATPGANTAAAATNMTAANPPAANAATVKPSAVGNTTSAPTQQAASSKPQPAAAAQKNAPAAAPGAALLKSPAPAVALVAPERPGGDQVSNAAPSVRVEDDSAPPPPKPPTRPLSGGVLNSKAVSLPPPAYPEAAMRMRVAGIVTVEVVIDVTGRVISAKAVAGPETLRDAAERAARQARFTPALLSGQPVKIAGTIDYKFKL